jgi:hypothetical protein
MTEATRQTRAYASRGGLIRPNRSSFVPRPSEPQANTLAPARSAGVGHVVDMNPRRTQASASELPPAGPPRGFKVISLKGAEFPARELICAFSPPLKWYIPNPQIWPPLWLISPETPVFMHNSELIQRFNVFPTALWASATVP